MIKLEKLMAIECILLEMEYRLKFNMSLNDVNLLYTYLNDVGKVTNLFFTLQEEYYDKFKDEKKLEEYHNKLLNEDIDMDVHKIIKFIDWIGNTSEDSDFRDVIVKNKFW